MNGKEPYWTLAETVVWICTRDFTRVSSICDIRSDAALAEETYKLLSERTRTVVSPPDLKEIRDGAPKPNLNVSGSADDQIIERARDGSVRAIGRRTWDGPLESISPAEFLRLCICTIPDGLKRGGSIVWLDVQFARVDVTRQWPELLLAIWPSDLAEGVEQAEPTLGIDTAIPGAPDEHGPAPEGLDLDPPEAADQTDVAAEQSEDGGPQPVASFPGRTSVMAAIKVEMKRRASADPPQLQPKLATETTELETWAKKEMPGVQTPTAKGIQNALRGLYRSLKENSAKTEKTRN